MKKVIVIENTDETINLVDVDDHTPIFAKKNGILAGLVVKESDGWILRIGGANGANGWSDIRGECISTCLQYGYEFFVE